jgi:hypothetical protein
MPDGPIINVAGLKFTAAGKTIPWRRDLTEMFSLHLDVPQGASTLDVDLDFCFPRRPPAFPRGPRPPLFSTC